MKHNYEMPGAIEQDQDVETYNEAKIDSEILEDRRKRQLEKDQEEYVVETPEVHRETLLQDIRQKKEKEGGTLDSVISEALRKKPDGDEKLDPNDISVEKAKKHQKSWLRRTFTAGLMSLGLLAAKQEAKAENLTDSTGKKQHKIERAKDTSKGDLSVYTESKTKEGGVTPTGKSNSFLENDDQLSEKDLFKMAETFGFRTSDNLAFQEDLINYTVKHYPEIIKEINEKYGRTALGEQLEKEGNLSPAEIDVQGLIDGNLGVRTWEIAKKVMEKKLTETTSKKQKTPEAEPQPKGGYVINVRGDMNGKVGVYYFFENEADFLKATDKIGGFSSREVKGDGTGQATYDMNASVFLDRYAKGNKRILGQGWLRDTERQDQFVKFNPKTTAHFYEGLAQGN